MNIDPKEFFPIPIQKPESDIMFSINREYFREKFIKVLEEQFPSHCYDGDYPHEDIKKFLLEKLMKSLDEEDKE